MIESQSSKIKRLNNMNKIGFIGGGKMATAIIKGIINSGLYPKENIFVSDKNLDALNSLKESFGINVTQDNSEIVKNTNILLFAVKPFVLRDVLIELKENILDYMNNISTMHHEFYRKKLLECIKN